MKIKLKDRKDISQWHPWFAWHPVIAVCHFGSLHWVWWQTVDRRWDGGFDNGNWEYRI